MPSPLSDSHIHWTCFLSSLERVSVDDADSMASATKQSSPLFMWGKGSAQSELLLT